MKNLITGIVAILALTGTIYLYAMSVLVSATISARGPQYLGEMHFFKTEFDLFKHRNFRSAKGTKNGLSPFNF